MTISIVHFDWNKNMAFVITLGSKINYDGFHIRVLRILRIANARNKKHNCMCHIYAFQAVLLKYYINYNTYNSVYHFLYCIKYITP